MSPDEKIITLLPPQMEKCPIITCTPLSAGGVNLQPNFQKGEGGLKGPQLLKGGWWERGGDIFQGKGCNFYIKDKLKSEIFNDKKSL